MADIPLAAPAAPDGLAAAARERRIGFACAFGVLFVWSGFLLSARLSPSIGLTPFDMMMLRQRLNIPTVIRHTRSSRPSTMQHQHSRARTCLRDVNAAISHLYKTTAKTHRIP